MPFVLNDRVLETCTSPGTGAVALLGTVPGYQTFLSGIGAGTNTFYYTLIDQIGTNWETGQGTYISEDNSITRNTVYASSNNNNPVNFTTGNQNIFVDLPGGQAVVNNGGTYGINISGNAANGNPVGTIVMWSYAIAPTGYLLCDGSAVSRTTYARLFSVISTTFGAGDGSTTFGLPNYTNRMPYGANVGTTGGSADAIVVSHTHGASSGLQSADHSHSGTTGGQSASHYHSGQTDNQNQDHSHSGTTGGQSASHSHGVNDPGHAHSIGNAWISGNGYNPNGAGSFFQSATISAASNTTGISIGNQSNDHSHNFSTGGVSANHSHSYSTSVASNDHSHNFGTGGVSANHNHAITVNDAGAAGTNANLPPYLGINFIIKI